MSRNFYNEVTAEAAKVIAEFDRYQAQQRGGNTQWYAGIANDFHRRRCEHRVHQTQDKYIAIQTSSEEVSRLVETYYHELGMQGAGGGGTGKGDARWVYIYKQTPTTKP